ncbi:MAG TPA: DUF6318 family protein [Demequina sp.]|nr:DUF6318 family protein [Demequina sp.]
MTPEDELLAQIPEDARGEDFYSASQFAKFFVAEYQRMFAEHDSALFALVSGDQCQFCASSLQSFADDEAAGSTVAGGEITPAEALASGGLQNDGMWLVQFPMHVAEASYFNEDESLRSTVAATDYNVGLLLDHVEGHWTVRGLNLEAAS